MTTTTAARTGIKSLDELIATAIEHGLDVEVEETEWTENTSYGVKITESVPLGVNKDSVLALELRTTALRLVYVRSNRAGARGKFHFGEWRNLHRTEKLSGPKAARLWVTSMGEDAQRHIAQFGNGEQQGAVAPVAPSEALRAVVDDITREEDAAAVSELYAAHREAEEQRAGEGVWVVLPEALPGTAVQGPYRVPARAVALHTEASGWGGQYRTYRVEVTEDVPRIGEAAQVEYSAGEVLTVEAAFFDAAPQEAVSAPVSAGEQQEAAQVAEERQERREVPQEAPARMRLQGVGWVPAVEASDLVVGDRVMWNFGSTSEVLAIKDVSRAFLVITFRSERGVVSERRMKKSGRSVARVGTFLAGV